MFRKWANKVVPTVPAIVSRATMCWTEYDFVGCNNMIKIRNSDKEPYYPTHQCDYDNMNSAWVTTHLTRYFFFKSQDGGFPNVVDNYPWKYSPMIPITKNCRVLTKGFYFYFIELLFETTVVFIVLIHNTLAPNLWVSLSRSSSNSLRLAFFGSGSSPIKMKKRYIRA